MDKDNSFDYVFWEILKFFEKIEIVYNHEALLSLFEDAPFPTFDGGAQWCLCLVSICEIEKSTEFEKVIADKIDSRIEYIKENRLDLHGFYKSFIARLGSTIDQFKKLQNDEINLESLINQKIVILEYLGYLPLGEHYHLHQLGMNIKPTKAEFDENEFDEVYKLLKGYFDIIIKELTKLILFLKHELNISIINRQQLVNQKGKDEFLKLIKEGNIEKLFKELDAVEDYKYDEELIQLSARYFKLENDKNKDVINRDDYNVQSAKLISSLIKAILRN